MLALALSLLAAQTSTPANPWVDAARSHLGTPYQWGGRKRPGEGLDCLGVVLAAAERATGCGWKSFPVNPTGLVQRRLVGERVVGLAPIASSALEVAKLEPGDVVMLVSAVPNPAEPAIGEMDGARVWVWHVGVYSGAGRWIVGDHFAGQTVETELAAYLALHADTYTGVFVTRPTSNPARPTRCRKHAPL